MGVVEALGVCDSSVCGIMEKRGCPRMGEVKLIKPERMGWLQFGEPSS